MGERHLFSSPSQRGRHRKVVPLASHHRPPRTATSVALPPPCCPLSCCPWSHDSVPANLPWTMTVASPTICYHRQRCLMLVLPIDGDGWGLTPPHLRGGTWSSGRVPVAGGLGAPPHQAREPGPQCQLHRRLLPEHEHVHTHPSSGEHVRPKFPLTEGQIGRRAAGAGPSTSLGSPPSEGPDRSWQDRSMSGWAGAGSNRSRSGRLRRSW
jgi:hypothetical protein